MYEAKQEILADFVGEKLFRDVNALAELAQKKRPLFERIVQWFKNLFAGNRGTATEQELRKMERLFEQAVGQRKGISEQNGTEKYFVNSFPDRKKFVDVQTDQKLFDGLDPNAMRKVAVKVIKSRFVGKVIGNNRAFVKSSSASEYGFPSRYLKDDAIIEAKMRASTELDNLVGVADNYRNEDDGEDGHEHPEATGGFDKYDVVFRVNDRFYHGVVNVEVTDRGKVFKDVTKIIDITDDTIAQYGEIPQGNFVNDISNPTIAQNDSGVNPYSTQETEKYSPFMMAERKSADVQPTAQQPSGDVDLSSVSTDQLRAELAARNPKEGIADIARLQPQDASTTPNIGDSGVRNRKGDGNSAFAESIQATDISASVRNFKKSCQIRADNEKNPLFQRVFCHLVEATGIEPVSENHLPWFSPSAAVLLRFPSLNAERQALSYGSRPGVTDEATADRSRSPLIDAFIPTAVLRVKTAA